MANHLTPTELADEAGGFRLEDSLKREGGVNGLSSVYAKFRRGRLIGQVAIVADNLSDQEVRKLEDIAKELLSKMNDQMAAVLAQ